ncbi:hypothetical protein [Cryobacterium sp. Y62]|uniref:hypothetical protein n=1 Tax=Cryobacterium sp. Y62 TaxID=2048284 RepID=UPI0011B076DC|nr:hypothetical protein [Cryobacterium sp. Y62]
MNQTTAKAPRRRLRRALHAIVAVATALVLTGCGALIDTTMIVASDGSGSRVMTLTLAADDAANLVGGAAAVDASVQKYLPAELSYSGVQVAPDGGIVLSLTMAFADSADYQKKAQALLAGGGDTTSEVNFSVTDSLLVKGITLDEDFTSYSLLKWMFDGLLADGVVAGTDSSNMYEVGVTVLDFAGTSVTQGSTYDYSSVIDNGFTEVSMATDITDIDQIERRIFFSVAAAQYAANEAVYDEYFSQSTPTGADLTMVSPGTWDLLFSGDAAVIASATDQALGTTGSTFEVKSGADTNDAATLTKSVTEFASCANICATGGDGAIHDAVSAGTDYQPQVIDVDLSADTPVRFDNSPPITSVAADFTFAAFGSVTATMAFTVDNTDVTLVGDGFTKLFTPATGSLTSKKGASDTTFTAVITGKDAEAFASAYAKWSPGATVSATESADSGFFARDYSYTIDAGLGKITGNHEVTGDTTTTISLPLGQRMTAATSEPDEATGLIGTTLKYSSADTRVSIQSSGPTVAGFFVLASLALAVIAGIIVLVKYRRLVLTKLQAARVRFDQGRVPSTLGTTFPAAPPRTSGSGSLFGLPAIALRPRPNQSMLDWPMQRHPLRPPGALIHLAKSGKRVTVKLPSLFSQPATPRPRTSGANLFDLSDALGTSRPRSTTSN